MDELLIGRKEEQQKLEEAFTSNQPEMVSIIGRRRIGKTFLVRSFFKGKIDFEVTGSQHGKLKQQLANFGFVLDQIQGKTDDFTIPTSWGDAFRKLIVALESLPPLDRKRVIFFDELPWLATNKSGFLPSFGWFWNNWASKQRIVVVICGSAASWMIDKVVNNTGGLHNRITKRIFLKPFSLAETESYFKERNINFERYQLLNFYMVMGGVPHYLQAIKKGQSAVQNIEAICFREGGLLRTEFTNLYPSLFENASNHIAVIRALVSKWKGLHRNEIIQITKIADGGGLTKVLEELKVSGFISVYLPFGKKKRDLIYRLTDEYSLFYLHFIEPNQLMEKIGWQKLSQTQTFKSWRGYAFENLCLKHVPLIKKALGIQGIYSTSSSFYAKGNEEKKGLQIDLLIDRADQVINLCELKFYNEPYSVTSDYSLKLRSKAATFKELTQTRKQLFWTMISTFGFEGSPSQLDAIDHDFDMNILFEEE